MSRRKPPQDSLELFLDAICNMFGGFIFLMLFVVVSMRTTSEKALEQAISEEGMTAAEFEAMELELQELQNRWDESEKLIESSREFANQLTTPEILAGRLETSKVNEEIRKTSEEITKITEEISTISARALRLDQQRKQAKLDLEKAEKELKKAQDDARELERATVRKSSPPQMRERGWTREIGVILKYGRLYLWHKTYDESALNSDDFYVVADEGTVVEVAPRFDRGVDLNAPGVVKKLDEAFEPFVPSRHHFALVVATDSYAEYAIVRDYLKSKNFETRPLLGGRGTYVFDRGGSESKTQ